MIKYKVWYSIQGRSDSASFAKAVEDHLNAYAPHGWRLEHVVAAPVGTGMILFLSQEVEDSV